VDFELAAVARTGVDLPNCETSPEPPGEGAAKFRAHAVKRQR